MVTQRVVSGSAADSPVASKIDVKWDTHLETEFFDYVEQGAVAQPSQSVSSPLASWRLFQLANTAILANMAADFDELLAIEHVQGFTPLPHQVNTAKRVLQELRGRAILADEVGLGKTIEAGLVLKEYLLRKLVQRVLILVPASLVLQWTRELNEKFRIPAVAQKKAWSWTAYDVLVASLDSAKREPHRSIVLDMKWDMIIVDEAHKLKNAKSKNWQLVNQLSAKYMLLVTATPVQNNLQELHTLITLLRPGQLGSLADFSDTHLSSPREAKDPSFLRQRVKTVMIRNRRRDGGVVLPERSIHVLPVTLNPEERRLYDSIAQFLRKEYRDRVENKGSLLPLMTLQREICSSTYAAMITLERMKRRAQSSQAEETLLQLMKMAEEVRRYTKVETVMKLLDGIRDKCVVFTEYRATQDFLLYTLRKNGIVAVPFRGGFGRGKKDWMKDLFANKAQILVATESGGEGINLQFCHHMINFDLPWNPMRLEQRIGRIHRLGQQHDVQVYHLATNDTIEEYIVHLLYDKIRMFETVVGEVEQILQDEKHPVSRFEKEVFKVAMTSSTDVEAGERLLSQHGEGGHRDAPSKGVRQ